MTRRPTSPGDTVDPRLPRLVMAAVRVMLALMWMQGAGWKNPSRFGTADGFFYDFVAGAVTYEVFPPWAWIVDNLILPNWTVFAWSVFLVEVLLGAFLLIGLATRLWAVVGIGQAAAILLSVAAAPDEWGWSYWLMIACHMAVWATAAGRGYGLDGVLRPSWLAYSQSVEPIPRVGVMKGRFPADRQLAVYALGAAVVVIGVAGLFTTRGLGLTESPGVELVDVRADYMWGRQLAFNPLGAVCMLGVGLATLAAAITRLWAVAVATAAVAVLIATVTLTQLGADDQLLGSRAGNVALLLAVALTLVAVSATPALDSPRIDRPDDDPRHP